MKLFKNILFIGAGLFIFLLNACTEDMPERSPSYVPASDVMEVYFPGDAKSQFEVEPTVSSIEVTVVRENTSGAASVGLTVKDYEGVFTVPGSVEFDAGEAETTIPISFEGLETFVSYKMELILEEEYTHPYDSAMNGGTTNFLVYVTQSDWVDYAIGTYNSTFLETEWEQVLQYSEILDAYRFPDLWAAGVHWEFKWDGGEAIIPGGTENSDGYFVVETGYNHPNYGMVSAATDPSTDYTYYSEADDMFKFDRLWTVSAGSFGWYAEYFTFTERY